MNLKKKSQHVTMTLVKCEIFDFHFKNSRIKSKKNRDAVSVQLKNETDLECYFYFDNQYMGKLKKGEKSRHFLCNQVPLLKVDFKKFLGCKSIGL